MNTYIRALAVVATLLPAFITFSQVQPVNESDLKCLTDNIYHEARSESLRGQALVGHSVINRMKDKRWSNNICNVVYKKSQYSWTDNVRAVKEPNAYILAKDLARTLLANKEHLEASGVTHYLRCDYKGKVNWWRKMTYLGHIGAHCFYKEEK